MLVYFEPVLSIIYLFSYHRLTTSYRDVRRPRQEAPTARTPKVLGPKGVSIETNQTSDNRAQGLFRLPAASLSNAVSGQQRVEDCRALFAMSAVGKLTAGRRPWRC